MMSKPDPSKFVDEDGYFDDYDYSMALDAWRSQFPDLYENWCGEPKPQPEPEQEESLNELLVRLLAA
jgi:broad specificity phosphatase PhoE